MVRWIFKEMTKIGENFFFFFHVAGVAFFEVNHGIYGYFVPLLQDNDEFSEIYFTSVW